MSLIPTKCSIKCPSITFHEGVLRALLVAFGGEPCKWGYKEECFWYSGFLEKCLWTLHINGQSCRLCSVWMILFRIFSKWSGPSWGLWRLKVAAKQGWASHWSKEHWTLKRVEVCQIFELFCKLDLEVLPVPSLKKLTKLDMPKGLACTKKRKVNFLVTFS